MAQSSRRSSRDRPESRGESAAGRSPPEVERPPRLTPLEGGSPREAPPDAADPRDAIVVGARQLAQRVRALQQRYEEEHRRLADTLEFLAVQSLDLERQLAEFGQLAAALEGSAPAAARGPSRAGQPAPDLEVHCLGTFQALYHGAPIDLGTSRRGRLVFKYLLVRAPGRRASKELLAELFWPEVEPERSLASLQAAVYQLRRGVARSTPALADRPLVVYAADAYALTPELVVVCDLDTFRAELARARTADAQGQIEAAERAYRAALEAYRGELLPEERYEEWVLAERAVLEAEREVARSRLLQIDLARGRYADVIAAGESLLEVDPTREDVHRELIRAYSRLGRRREALRQYRRCVDALRRELNLAPEAETTALHQQLLRGEAV